MRGQGHQIFVDELAGFATGFADGRVAALAERVAAPLGVLVQGRPAVGCRTVAHALDRAGGRAGMRVAASTDADLIANLDADLVLYVTTEVVKPEDIQAIQAIAPRPVLAVLNKADLLGFAGDGPVAVANSRCAHFSALIGVPVQPMIGLLAVAALDDPGECLDEDLWTALRVLAAHPGGAASLEGCHDGFLAADSPVPTEVRQRLLDTLDLFGTALGVAAVKRGRTAAQVRALLRRVSCVDAVVDKIAALGAEVRYRRILKAVAELEAMAVADEEISEFLRRDDTVLARMASAVAVAEAAGLEVGPCDDPADHLAQALRWQRYSVGGSGLAGDIHRACGADIARGSLRLWAAASGASGGAG
jgi:hypothetical protein